ncbi:MAG: hypothetical protein ACRDRZ_17115, partial [Pseudonocardiaceae bacterium]
GRGGMAPTAPMAGGAGRGRGGEDTEHQRAGYLVERDENAIIGEIPATAPPVIGEEPDVYQRGE